MLTIISSLLIICPLSNGYASSDYYGKLNNGACPFITQGTPPENKAEVPCPETYNSALSDLDINEVFNDIYDLLTNSQSCWPADTFNDRSSYSGLFIRLAWHCSGTFRSTDNRGGCGGGRQRFQPESAWDDNVNLDKARALLVPIKNKFGDALSWGDLMVFAGTASIIAGGGPVTQVCAGRIDEPDGTESLPLGPGPQQIPPCLSNGINGDCPKPLGASTEQLIYVNPEGILGNPDPARSAISIREIFGRMGWNDTETVALIGGGHAFGKCHGACDLGPGPGPIEEPFNPWPGACGTGRGIDTFTSGLEGQWTTFPLKWDNEFFEQLINDKYSEPFIGPGGRYQFKNLRNGNLMLTTDLAFVNDDIYYQITKQFANNLNSLDIAFSAAWERLVTNGGGFAPNKKCVDGSELIVGFTNNDGNNDRKKGKKKGGRKQRRKARKAKLNGYGYKANAEGGEELDLLSNIDDNTESGMKWSYFAAIIIVTLSVNALMYALVYGLCIRHKINDKQTMYNSGKL